MIDLKEMKTLTQKQLKIYDYFKNNPGMTTYRAGMDLGLLPSYVGTVLKGIEEKGYIRVGVINNKKVFSKIIFLRDPYKVIEEQYGEYFKNKPQDAS